MNYHQRRADILEALDCYAAGHSLPHGWDRYDLRDAVLDLIDDLTEDLDKAQEPTDDRL